MKQKNKTKLLLLVMSIFLLSGCDNTLKNVDGKAITNTETGQVLTTRILCKPQSEESLKKYRDTYNQKLESINKKLEANEINIKEKEKLEKELLNIDNLVECNDLKPFGNTYRGIFDTFIFTPFGWLIVQLTKLTSSSGLSIILSTILISLLTYQLNNKQMEQSKNMNLMKPEIEKIEKKFAGKTSEEDQIKKQQQIMLLYKKYNINMFSSIMSPIIQIVIMIAFAQAISAIPLLFESTFLNFQLGTVPSLAITSGKFYYIIIPILTLLTTYLSLKTNAATGDKKQMEMMKSMTNTSLVLMGMISFITPIGVSIYLITSSTFRVIQNLIMKKR